MSAALEAFRDMVAPLKLVLADLKQALREMFSPTWEHDDETDLEVDAAVRTEIVRKMRHPEEP